MQVVPTNVLQRRLHEHRSSILGPATGAIHSANGVILEVYTKEVLNQITVPILLKKQIEETPGLLFAQVQLGDIKGYWPFKHSEDYVHLVYGNAVMLRSQRCKIEWDGMNIANGFVVLQRDYSVAQADLNAVCEALDIGGIV